MSPAATERLSPAAAASRRQNALFRRTYPFRTLGMSIGVLPVAIAVHEVGGGWMGWAWLLFCGLLWPHVAWLHARRSRDPYRAEQRNLLVDSAMVGTFMPLMHFNLLPSAMLVTMTSADKINSGVRGLLLRSMPAIVAGTLVAGLLGGFHVDLHSSTRVIMASLPVLMIHTLAVSAYGYQLMRKVQQQNLQLRELSQQDSLTGLQSRRHWEDQARALLATQAAMGRSASLMLIDVDRFKDINDRLGHMHGDDVLRALAGVIREQLPPGSHPGRLGGDEFAVALPLAAAESQRVAERIRRGVEAIDCSVSIGIAPMPAVAELRAWMDAADRALYQAKAAGRNRVQASAEPAPA